MTMLFQLKKKCGNHIGPPDKNGNRITYKAGDKVPSDDDLVEKYPNKFELISKQISKADIPAAPNIPTPKKKGGKGKKEKEFNRDGTEYKDMEDPVIPEIPEPEKSEYGVDVTKDFPTAPKVGLKVFEKSKWFAVIDPDNDEVLNDKKLRRSKVEDFLAEYLPDTDDEDENDFDEEDDEDEE